uniref:PLAC domain-containing protein n=1 Tax=Globodera pallida TaxID=36090 RepID=A0A183BHK4_GLOPA
MHTQFFESVTTHAGGGEAAVVGELRFRSVNVMDGGAYSCAFGDASTALISEPVIVRVTEADPSLTLCPADNGPAHVCRTVARTGLCSTLRYGRYCCRTCAIRS